MIINAKNSKTGIPIFTSSLVTFTPHSCNQFAISEGVLFKKFVISITKVLPKFRSTLV